MATSQTRMDTIKYWTANRQRVKGLNKRAGEAIKKKLSRIPHLNEDICISAIVSDGRLEKGLDSKLELQIVNRGLNKSAIVEVDMMLREIEINGQLLLNGSETEVKTLGLDLMAYAYSLRAIPAPARLLDSVVLFGKPEIATMAKAELVSEFIGKVGRRLLEKLKERKRTFKGITETGKQMWKGLEYCHFDLERGVAYFDDIADSNGGTIGLRGFKHGPLRYVQCTLEQNVTSYVRSLAKREAMDAAVDFVAGMPTPTVEKLEYLYQTGASSISQEAISEASECYLRFLRLYHISEWMAAKGRLEMEFNTKEAKEAIGSLTRIMEGGIVSI